MKNIISRDNPSYKQLKKLAETARERRKAGRTLLDGVHLIEAYLASGGMPLQVVVSESGLAHPECAALLRGCASVPGLVLADALFAEISPVETPVGILAEVAIPAPAPAARPGFGVLLEDVQDPGNLGSILRSAAAAGADVVYLTTHCADAWSPKTLRAGMGAHFALALVERCDAIGVASRFDGVSVAASLDAETSLFDLDLTGRVLFMVGNEGAGLSPVLQQTATHRVRIPMPGRIESLNAAAAAAVCFFERVRQQVR